MWKIIVSAVLLVILFSGCVIVGEQGHIYNARAYRAYVDFSDSLGPPGFYASEAYACYARFLDATDPLHVYDY